ncbi:MAG: Fe-S cluster protein [Candidatus Magasanikbacteria bacterium]|nr:Fe-S cluster protein [Candidatus Magasanikbacteria bacterium]|tara:strand:- start:7818 stop:8195 length:378 start_codon:yes stop_codon:yes gene_type:complete
MDDILYKEYILELHRNPLHKKVVPNAQMEAKEVNTSCGDEISVQIYSNTQGVIEDIGHQGQGCAISQAAVSLLTDFCLGKSVREVVNITDEEMVTMLGIHISYARKNCALLGLKALQHAITNTTI